MERFPRLLPLRRVVGLGLVAASLISGSSAFAGSYSYQVTNFTLSGGDPVFSVVSDVTFTHLLLQETFVDGFTTEVPLENFDSLPQTSLDTNTLELDSAPFTLSDPVHGGLSDAVLTGSLQVVGAAPGAPLTLTLQPSFDPNSQYTQIVARTFRTDLLGPDTGGPALGTFSLLDSTGDPFLFSYIEASPVPETSTLGSLGLMLALGLTALVAVRRRSVAAQAK